MAEPIWGSQKGGAKKGGRGFRNERGRELVSVVSDDCTLQFSLEANRNLPANCKHRGLSTLVGPSDCTDCGGIAVSGTSQKFADCLSDSDSDLLLPA